MTDAPACTVIIPTYNRCKLLGFTLQALTRQTLPVGQFEVIVVDDGSCDATAEVVAAFRPRLRLRYFFQPDEGYRVARARNIGITEAAGEVCVFIDSGVIPGSGCIAAHVTTHRTRPRPAAVCGYVYGFDDDNENGEEIQAAFDPADPDGAIAAMRADGRWLDSRETFYDRHPDLGVLPAPWVVYWGCNASARTDQLKAVGMFDENHRSWGGEDTDLGYRLHRDGATFVLDREAVAIHWPHEKDREANRRAAQPNYARFIEKYPDPIPRLLATVHLMELNDVLLAGRLPNASGASPGGPGRN